MTTAQNKLELLLKDEKKRNCLYQAVFFVFSFLYIWLFCSDILYQIFWNNYFVDNELFQCETIRQTGGLLMYCGRFLNQIFAYNIPSGLFVAFLLTILQGAIQKVFCISQNSILSFIPSFLFLFELTTARYSIFFNFEISYFFAPLLGVFSAILICFANNGIKNRIPKWGRISLFALTTVLLYPFIGMYSTVALTLVIIDEQISKFDVRTIPIPIFLFILLPWITSRFFFSENYWHAFFAPLPDLYFTNIIICNILIILSVCCISLFRTREFKLGVKSSGVAFLTLCLFFIGWIHTPSNALFRSEMKAIRLTDETDWNGVLKNLPQQVSKIQNAYRIIALAQTNQLSSRLFDVRLPFRQSCEKSPFLIYSPDLYFYGAMPAMTTAFDMEKWTWMGETYKGLDLFVKTALIQEKWNLAKRYIDVMKQSFALKSRADNYEKYIGNKDLLLKENPDLRIIDEHRFKEDRTFSVMNHFPNQFLSYKDFPINNIERRLLADLYTKNLDLFLSDLKIAKQVYKSFPPYMQQALVVKAMEMKNPKVLQMIPVNRMEVERIQQFKKDVAKYGGRNFEKAASELYEQYANNYAYFYMFNNEDFSSSAIHYIKK